jgi:acyl-CoA thioesterase-1
MSFLLLLAFLPGQQPIKIVCLGDSVTKAVRLGVKPSETFCAQLEQLLTKSGRPATVINSGIGGHTSAQGLARFYKDVLAHKPTLVVVMFGLNDAWVDKGKTTPRVSVDDFRNNLKTMVARLRQDRVTPVLMTPNPQASPPYKADFNALLRPYVLAMREVARQDGVHLVDLYRVLAELNIEGTSPGSLYVDGEHPNPRGQLLIAELLLKELTPLLTETSR